MIPVSDRHVALEGVEGARVIARNQPVADITVQIWVAKEEGEKEIVEGTIERDTDVVAQGSDHRSDDPGSAPPDSSDCHWLVTNIAADEWQSSGAVKG